MRSPIQTYLERLHQKIAPQMSGALASYIPELTKADPNWFGISIVTMDGVAYSVGDTDQQFTIQSISKPFVYATALADRGLDFVNKKVGVEPSGDAFNSISLDPQTGAPINPMINAGAICTTSLVNGDSTEQQWQRIESSLSAFAGRSLAMEESVYRSESATGHRNRAIAWMLKNFSMIDGEPMASLENYFRQCSVLVNCQDIAFMAATLANGGIHPLTRKQALPTQHIERVLSVMATCGMYDYSGNWLFEVGMPAKSGVGGGIMAVLPGRFGIGIFSPLLDGKGNSVRGIEVCKQLSKDFKLHVFTRNGDPSMALGRIYTGAQAPSRRHPAPEIRPSLDEQAHRIKYLHLHGFIAIDGMEYIVRKMQTMESDSNSFILDMHQVDGLSDSAARILNDARIEFAKQGIAVVISRAQGRQAIQEPITKTLRSGNPGFLNFEDNDIAAEWCENRLVGELALEGVLYRPMAECQLLKHIPAPLLRQLESIATEKVFAPGERIITAGDESGGQVFIIESGHVGILVPLEQGGHQRISSLGPGMSLGEMVLLGQTRRSATVHAETQVTCKILSAGDLDRIAEVTPALRTYLLENLAIDLTEKLLRATKWIGALA